MVHLPEDFVCETRRIMGDERFERYLKAFEEEPPVSIRLNPRKSLVPAPSPNKEKSVGMSPIAEGWGGEPVPWCSDGYYLARRPNFTMDPLFHAGCYYVQEASSMFLWHVVNEELRIKNEEFAAAKVGSPERDSSFFILHSSFNCLDLCAAPGGKSTLLRSVLPEGSTLISNEPIRNRYQVLAENVQKWGYPDHVVTNLYPRDFVKGKQRFDLILCDVPCSGEGMFRKDAATIGEWSLRNVEKCQQLQREIVSDAWKCLNDGGLLIYSTCTLNTKENEENVRWIVDELGAEVLPVATKPEWNITGSLLEGFTEPVYRFIPGIARGEGLFLCVLRKGGVWKVECGVRNVECGMRNEECGRRNENRLSACSLSSSSDGKNISHSTFHTPHSTLYINLSYSQAIAYLRGEALVLPEDTPRGLVTVAFMGHPLGQVKNIGSRANNLYPKAWRIKTTHIPQDYEAILRHS